MAAGLVCFRDGSLLVAMPQEAFLSGSEFREEAVSVWLQSVGCLANNTASRGPNMTNSATAAASDSVRLILAPDDTYIPFCLKLWSRLNCILVCSLPFPRISTDIATGCSVNMSCYKQCTSRKYDLIISSWLMELMQDTEDNPDDWQEPCEICGRRYHHEHIRSTYTGLTTQATSDSDNESQ